MSAETTHTSGWRDAPAVRVWRVANFRRLMSGVGAYYATSWMQRVGVGWLAWELSHSHAWVGLIAAADLLPLMVLGPFAGAIADRMDPAVLLKRSQLGMIAQAIALAATTAAGLASVELLFALSLVSGLLHPTYTAARQMLVPTTVAREDFGSAVTYDSILFHGSRFVGPVLAALLIAQTGVIATFVIHIVGCLAFYLQTVRLRMAPPKRGSAAQTSILASIGEGMAYARRHEGIWPLFLMLSVASFFARPLQELLPGFAGGVFEAGPTGLAWLTSGMGLGSLGAGIFLSLRGRVEGLARASIAATCALGFSTLGFVVAPNLSLAVPYAVVWGFALTLMGVGIQAQTQVAIADGMRGRVMMIYAIIYRGLPAMGAVIVGALSEKLGIRSVFVVCALVTIAAWLAIAPRHRAIDAAMEQR